MNKSVKLAFGALSLVLLASGCAQKVRIKALQPAEVGAMASKKKVAVSAFRHDSVGLSGKIEAKIAKQELDKKRYFTVLSRSDMAKVIAEQKLQSSELMDASTSTKVGKLIGAQAIINGEIASANAESGSYQEERKECTQYSKDSGCVHYRYYKVTCNTTQATVAANINIVNVETGSIIYGDTITKEYSADSCKAGKPALLSLLQVNTAPQQILSKSQALNRLASNIANEFVYKLTPNYVYFSVTLIDKIELDKVTDAQEKKIEIALAYIKQSRYDKAKKLLEQLMDTLNGKSYAVSYDLGVVYEATGDFDKAKGLYKISDDLTVEPVKEINLAINRIDGMIAKREEAKRQMNTK